VISETKNYRFFGRIRTFYRRKADFNKNKHFPRSAVCRDDIAVLMKNFVRSYFEISFQARDFSFWITDGIGLAGAGFHF
jgi:hypothetical protein